MRDPETFEARLAAAYRRYADEVTSDVDPLVLARAITARPARMPLTWSRLRPLRLALLLGLLVALALAAAALVGSLPSPAPAGISNGWIAFAASPVTAGLGGEGEFRDVYLTREGATARRIIGSAGDGRSYACPTFSPDGSRMAYGDGDESVGRIDLRGRNPITNRAVVVVAMGSDGEPSPPELRVSIGTDLGPPLCPEWSEDGSHLAFFTGAEVWVVDAGSGVTTTLPVDPRPSDGPGWSSLDLEWSPDGKTIAVAEPGRIRILPIDGAEPTVFPVGGALSSAWVADGHQLIYLVSATGPTGDAIHVIDIDTRLDRVLRADATSNGAGSVVASPDGNRLAYQRYVGGRAVAMDADGSNEIVLPDLGGDLLWSPDGQRLLSRGWDYPTDGAVAELITVAVMPGSLPVVTSFPDLAFEHMHISHVSWQAVHK